MKIDIPNSAEIVSSLKVALTSMGYDSFTNTREEGIVLGAFLATLQAGIEREATYDDSRSHNRVEGHIDHGVDVYCEYHEQYEESDE